MINPSKYKHSTKKAFTLAEVLITLAIIGVVAAMIIPSLIQGQQEKATVTAVKKVYSTLSNAYKSAEQENGTPDTWGMTTGNVPTGDAPMLNMIKPYLNVTKDCTNGSSGCFPAGVTYKWLGSMGTYRIIDSWGYPTLRLSDGTLIMAAISNSSCGYKPGYSLSLQNVCGEYYVDINGYKGPNQWGKDLFSFWLTKYGIVPEGSELQTADTWSDFVNNCKNKDTQSGYGCAAWVIYNENLDYLHCNGLDWDGPTKCP